MKQVYFTYDADGNMTSVSDATGYTLYVFDGENRLVEVRPNTPALGQKRVTMAYDFMGRRIKKDVYVYTIDAVTGTGTWTLDTSRTFTWDGWLMTDETVTIGSAQPETTLYVWGFDLSQTLTGAGGVGGLLSMTNEGDSSFNCYLYDANGNVTQLFTMSAAMIAAQYEFDVFGNMIFTENNGVDTHQIRWSSKYCDNDTGLLYYGYRYYAEKFGRWLSKDMLGENGGTNLYLYLYNSPTNLFDIYGLLAYAKGDTDPKIEHDKGAGDWASKDWTFIMGFIKESILLEEGIITLTLPDAKRHMKHYFENTGTDLTIRLQNMINDVPSAKSLYENEIEEAQKFVEALPSGSYKISSTKASSGYDTKKENWNWFYAVGGYSAWGKGIAIVCHNVEYTILYEYKFEDKYNWDKGKGVSIFGISVSDKFMGKFHRMGIAKEFMMYGSVKKTIQWKQGKKPIINDGFKITSYPERY